MIKRLFVLCLLTVISASAFAQGSIVGTITDAKTGEAIIGANVVLAGTTTGSATDIDGKYAITNIPAGTYDLSISYITYKTYTATAVVVENAKRVTIDVKLQEEATELAEVVVQAARQTDTDFELLRTIKEAKVIAVGISAEQISKTLDRDAAQVLRRVPGITIKDDQFVVVRGLAARYNAVMLHNTYAPSVETDVRSFSFATLPSSQIDRVIVYKSPAADLPGDFAGGVVKVFTKSIPEENGFVIDYSTQVRAGTTFGDYYGQKRDAASQTGFNGGLNDLPKGVPADIGKYSQTSTPTDINNVGKLFPNNWTPIKGMAIPDQRLTLTMNRKFNIGKVQVGNITALNYSNTYATYKVDRGDYTESPGKIDPNYQYHDTQYNQAVRTGALFNWAFKFSPKHLIEFKNLYNQSSNDQFVDRIGYGIRSGGQHNGAFDKVYRGLYSGQLMGTHDLFDDKTKIEWVAGYNNSNRNEPDYRRFRTDEGAPGQQQVYVQNSADPNYLGRFYSTMKETAYSGGVSVKQLFDASNPLLSPELKVGAFAEHKERTFHARNIGYRRAPGFVDSLSYLPIAQLMDPQNIRTPGGIQIDENSQRRNSYTAQNDLLALYAMGSIPMGERIKLDAGVRVEHNIQQIHSYDDLLQLAVDKSLNVTRLLPSANLSYNFTDKQLIRAAYGQTLNRPEFRELAPFSYYDFNYNFVYVGNSALKTAKIQNLDLRYEIFPHRNELITIGAFYKDFRDPIEVIVDINSPGGGVKTVYFNNAQRATSYGVEIEVKKSLQGLTGSAFLDKFNVMLNASLIKSKVKIPANLAGDQDTNRPMQGQAPYVVNAALYYNDEASGWQVNALYNVVGKSLAFVGNSAYHSVYLMPRSVVDLTFSKRLGERFQLKGGISDILNQSMMLLQDADYNNKLQKKTSGKDIGDRVIQSYKPGQVFSIGFSFRI